MGLPKQSYQKRYKMHLTIPNIECIYNITIYYLLVMHIILKHEFNH